MINFFDHLDTTFTDVELSNIFNYNEINFTDDPKVKKVIVHQGMCHVERKVEHSKQSISIMFCGSATGEYFPPMIVYKAQNVYAGWCVGGPPGATYDSTSSGWFDSRTSEHWFLSNFFDNVASRPGIKVSIEDNLALHFLHNAIQLAESNNIRFVTLPPNTTQLCQPLDVAVFCPVKRLWRHMLNEWRKESRMEGSIPKPQFPGLFRQLYENLVVGFCSCDLCPLDRTQVLRKIPGTSCDRGGLERNAVLSDSVMELFHTHCGVGVERQ